MPPLFPLRRSQAPTAVPAEALRTLPALLALPTLLALLALIACGRTEPATPGAPAIVAGDTDRDGFAPPEDCFDGPFAWTTVGALCDGSSPLRFLPHDGSLANDFTLAEWKGRVHLVHIRTQGAWWLPGNAVDFGHEVTGDLRNWSARRDLQLRGSPGSWNDRNVWSPHLVRAGDQWALFYTGVTYADDPAHNRQRIGLAFSSDLRTFHPCASTSEGVEGAGCVLDATAAWTAYASDEPWTGDCRDPFVVPTDDGWAMFLTVRLARAGYPQAIARAVSSDLTRWQLVDLVEATVGTVAESAALVSRRGGYLLMWTSGAGQRWAWGEDILGTFTLGGPAPGGYACELLPLDDGSFLFASVRAFGIDLRRLEVLDAATPMATPAVPSLTLRLSVGVTRECQVPGADIHPGRLDPKNGLDDNCDGLVDAVRPIEVLPRDHSREPRGRRPTLEPISGRW